MSAGAKTILYNAKMVSGKKYKDGSLAMLTIDISNDFNMVNQSTLLGEVNARYTSISLLVEFLYMQQCCVLGMCILC